MYPWNIKFLKKVQRDKLKQREAELAEKVDKAEKKIRENQQTHDLLKEKKDRTDAYAEKLTKELDQLKQVWTIS